VKSSAPTSIEWKSHGAKFKGSEAIWIGVLGPDTPARGERAGTMLVTQGQVAATIAALLGEDYLAATPAAARPIAEAIYPASSRITESARYILWKISMSARLD